MIEEPYEQKYLVDKISVLGHAWGLYKRRGGLSRKLGHQTVYDALVVMRAVSKEPGRVRINACAASNC